MAQGFLGSGMKFPPQIDPATGRFRVARGEGIHLSDFDDAENGALGAAGIRFFLDELYIYGYRCNDAESGFAGNCK